MSSGEKPSSSLVDSAMILAIATALSFVWGLNYIATFYDGYGLPLGAVGFSSQAAFTAVAAKSDWFIGVLFSVILLRAFGVELPSFFQRPSVRWAAAALVLVMVYFTIPVSQKLGRDWATKYGKSAPVVEFSAKGQNALPVGYRFLVNTGDLVFVFKGNVSATSKPVVVAVDKNEFTQFRFVNRAATTLKGN